MQDQYALARTNASALPECRPRFALGVWDKVMVPAATGAIHDNPARAKIGGGREEISMRSGV